MDDATTTDLSEISKFLSREPLKKAAAAGTRASWMVASVPSARWFTSSTHCAVVTLRGM